jgi:hypothetical protein
MRPITLLAALLALACENPIDHFTEGLDRGDKMVIQDCPADSNRVDSVRTCGSETRPGRGK